MNSKTNKPPVDVASSVVQEKSNQKYKQAFWNNPKTKQYIETGSNEVASTCTTKKQLS